MISARLVTSSADFNDQLSDAKSFCDISPADLETFVLVKLLEYECSGQMDAATLDDMRRYLWALRDM